MKVARRQFMGTLIPGSGVWWDYEIDLEGALAGEQELEALVNRDDPGFQARRFGLTAGGGRAWVQGTEEKKR